MFTFQDETAPLPYVSIANGNWDNPLIWSNPEVQMLPNSNDITWNIVKTQHNISSGNRATEVLGLLVDNNTYSITNNQSLRVTNYLKIDGVLDLQSESQLLQNTGSIVDYTGTGYLERDQQGTTNLYNYNYWGSPVGSNNTHFTVGYILHDGNTPSSPQQTAWTTAHDANGATTPVTMSSRWLYLYENYPEDSYADWNAINQTSNINTGLGFTMKGSGYSGTSQNYTFRGQPNNGTITSPVTGNNQALIGNPYPSAIDANTFILENAGNITGPLYFWEHSTTNASHNLSDYEGGYATYSLVGGVAATAPPSGLSGIGNIGKIPSQFIPVAQGFYVTGDSDGGTVLFTNNQRAFVKETSTNSTFIRVATAEEELATNSEIQDTIPNQLIRLDFKTPEGAIRHLLLGFVPTNIATDGVDYGYDSLNEDNFPNDMSFNIEGNRYIIQGLGTFDDTKMYPFDISLTTGGPIEVILDTLENFETPIDIFVFDALLGTYTHINNISYQTTLTEGEYIDRFFIAFKDNNNTLSVIDNDYKDILVNYLQKTNEIYVKTPPQIDTKQIYVINVAGQIIKSWNMTNLPLASELKIPVKNISEGTYIIKIETSTRSINKKIIIKY